MAAHTNHQKLGLGLSQVPLGEGSGGFSCLTMHLHNSTDFSKVTYIGITWRGPFSEPCHNLVPTFSVWLCAGYFSLSTCYHLESPGKTDLEGPSQMWDVTSMGRWLGLWKKAEHCSGCGPSNRPSSWRLLQFLL